MHQYYFEKMRVWKNTRILVNDIYTMTKEFPPSEEYHLKSQMRRAASSVKSNIAEGQGRRTKKDQAHYTTMSYSSLIELLNHLITAVDQKYVDDSELNKIRIQIDQIAGQLSALRKVQEQKMEH